ncbi:MAG: DUF4127 family protein [Casimicrobium sp.]
MTQRKVIYGLPVDARPVVRSQVQALVACAGWSLVAPDIKDLGHFREAANCDRLARWLLRSASEASGFVLSLDMLLYGGLVPSRFADDSFETIAARLQTLHSLRKRAPKAPIYVFAATMRISNNNVNEEEKTYWSEYGELIWRWSFFTDRATLNKDRADAAVAAKAKAAIPAEIREDYLATRARNHHILKRCVDLLEAGVIDRLIFPQDDTAAFGFNVAERRELEAIVAARSLQDRVLIYPGADEVMHTLCAHLVSTLESRAPLKCYLIKSDPKHYSELNALYEDGPISASLARQLTATRIQLVRKREEADVLLAVHSSGDAQGDWAMQKPLPSPQSIAPSWLAAVTAAVAQKQPVCVIDVAYANGGDPRCVNALAETVGLKNIAMYAGWNTASNSIGCALAQCVLAHRRTRAATNRQMLALRLAEDYLYQSVYRQVLRIGYPHVVNDTLTAQALRERVRNVFMPAANAWLASHGFSQRVRGIRLPWNRTFEIDIEFEDGAGAKR